MFAGVDLRALSEMSASERVFLSVYLSGPRSVAVLEKKFTRLQKALARGSAERDEREHFDHNVEMVRDYLARKPLESGGLCVFACWALDFFQTVSISAPVDDHVCVDSSPYIRPLAELQDEYENVAVLVADNSRARVYLVSSAVAGTDEKIVGNIKNHVRKGGWSQQRYERRRDKQLLGYAREIVEALKGLDERESFRRILFVGGKEILRIVSNNLPNALAKKVVGRKAIDLGRGDKALQEDLWELFFKEESQSGQRLWETIRSEYLRGGLGIVGIDDVVDAVRTGRIEKMVVIRTFRPEGTRCRECEHLHHVETERCVGCESASVYAVDLVNEICELLHRTSAEVDFVDPAPTLIEAGSIGALLRY